MKTFNVSEMFQGSIYLQIVNLYTIFYFQIVYLYTIFYLHNPILQDNCTPFCSVPFCSSLPELLHHPGSDYMF